MNCKVTIHLLLTFLVISAASISSNGNVKAVENGEGYRLAVYLSPPVIPADGKSYRCIYVQIQDSEGRPVILRTDLLVTLTSSNLDVGTVNNKLIIPAGDTFSTAIFNTTHKPGVTTITASAPGFKAGMATLRTVNPYSNTSTPIGLRIHITPRIFPAIKGLSGVISVQLLSSDNTPLTAYSDINVIITTTNTTVIRLPESITIKSGASYGSATFKITGRIGRAIITAQAQGYKPDNATVLVVKCGGEPTELALALNPKNLPPDNTYHKSLIIYLLDRNGEPTIAKKDIRIYLTTSNNKVAETEKYTVIMKGKYYTITRIRTKLETGTTVITASAQNLKTATVNLKVKGFKPSRLKVYTAPPLILADGRRKNIISIQIQDKNGLPIASWRDIIVYLSSSSINIGSVPSSIKIDKGESQATVYFTSTSNPGVTTITAQAQGLEAASATLQTTVLPLNLTIEAPPTAKMNDIVKATIKATSRGQPIQNVTIIWMISGGQIINRDDSTDKNGEATVTFKQIGKRAIITVEAIKNGYRTTLTSKRIETVTAGAIGVKRTLEINLLGFKIPLLTLLVIITAAISVLVAIYSYAKIKTS